MAASLQRRSWKPCGASAKAFCRFFAKSEPSSRGAPSIGGGSSGCLVSGSQPFCTNRTRLRNGAPSRQVALRVVTLSGGGVAAMHPEHAAARMAAQRRRALRIILGSPRRSLFLSDCSQSVGYETNYDQLCPPFLLN